MADQSNTPPHESSYDDLVRYAARPQLLRGGNHIRILRGGGEAYPAMLEAIASAQVSVCLETYILQDDNVGRRFAAALSERASAGLSVRLIYDAIGGLGLPRSYVRALRESGVEVLEFHPIKPWKVRFNLNLRDHRKILVVDHQVAFTGGLNISDDYAPESEGGEGWYDMHCEVRGPLVYSLERLFRRVWVREGQKFFAIPRYRPSKDVHADGCLARVIDNRKFRHRRKIRRAYLHAINRARERIYIMNAYFLPDRGTRRALRKAVKRGVHVEVILPEKSDVAMVLYAGQYIHGKLLRAGIKISIWPARMMHAKIAVVDSIWAAIGSYNMDSRSLRYNLEVLVEIVDRKLGAYMNNEFEKDAEHCTRLTYDKWKNRPLWKRMLSWLFYRFRRWL